MARPRKDPGLKTLRGTLRKDREPAVPATAIVGPMIAPMPLTERALAHFDTVTRLLRAEGRSSQHFAYTVAIFAQRVDQIETLQETIAEEGTTYDTVSQSGSLMHRSRPEVQQLSDAMRHAQALLSELMLSPTAALRLGKAEKPKTNRFAEL